MYESKLFATIASSLTDGATRRLRARLGWPVSEAKPKAKYLVLNRLLCV